jgi:hypothetical protein
MWVMLNGTPFSADRGCFRDRRGAEIWMGVLRSSFSVRPDGRLERAEQQTKPRRSAAWSGEPGQSSLLDESDFRAHTGTDLLIMGDAHAPGGKASSAVDVSFRIGGTSKALRVHGERVWVRSARSSAVVPGPAQPFERMPLDYERAFGGSDPDAPPGQSGVCGANPIGSGFRHRPEALLGKPAPQLEHVGAPLVAGPHQQAPAGFGPIAAHWQPRLALAGTYDRAWQERRAPLPPDDYREEFVRSAPQVQQLPEALRGGELIELTNLTPEGSFRVRVPQLGVRMTTIFSDGSELSEARLQTLRLFPDERRVELSWVATTPCQGREHKLLRARLECAGERSWQ